MTLNKGTPSASQAVRNGEGGAVRDGGDGPAGHLGRRSCRSVLGLTMAISAGPLSSEHRTLEHCEWRFLYS